MQHKKAIRTLQNQFYHILGMRRIFKIWDWIEKFIQIQRDGATVTYRDLQMFGKDRHIGSKLTRSV